MYSIFYIYFTEYLMTNIPEAYYRVSAKAWITDQEWRALFCRNCEDSRDVLWWGIDHGESPQEALLREIAEETGLSVTHVSQYPLFFDPFQTKKWTRRANIYYKVELENIDITPTLECLEVKYIWKDEMNNYTIYERLKLVANQYLF